MAIGKGKIRSSCVTNNTSVSLLMELLPKALLADIAWNFAQIVCGEENTEKQVDTILEEAQVCRPDTNWGMALQARIKQHLRVVAARMKASGQIQA